MSGILCEVTRQMIAYLAVTLAWAALCLAMVERRRRRRVRREFVSWRSMDRINHR